MPIENEKGLLQVFGANLTPERITQIKKLWGENLDIIAKPWCSLSSLLGSHFGAHYLHNITYSLYESDPIASAKNTFDGRSRIETACAFLVLSGLFITMPLNTLYWSNLFLNASVAILCGYKFFLSSLGFMLKSTPPDLSTTSPSSCPIYTVLLPMYQEKAVTIDSILRAIDTLDYPHDRLDVKILLEKDDTATATILSQRNLPPYIDILTVPAGSPRTKPRACNYGLALARGEYITVYDAEDQPDPNQLRIVLETLRKADSHVIGAQCPLSYYNRKQNLLTRLFSLEYACWFDLVLKGLDFCHLPIPLGGTSNHFKTEYLKAVGGWDPFNVTEDADLGIRIRQYQFEIVVTSSTTYEEANCRLLNWFKQRSRWIKGYMQTYLVHTRRPIQMIRKMGLLGFLSFQLTVGGNIFATLFNPILLCIFLWNTFNPDPYSVFLFDPPWVWSLAVSILIFGNATLILSHLFGAIKRRQYDLIPYALLMPFYWLMMGAASYNALYELIRRPNFWYKTEHGIA